jgi:membrane peptidoglycan carboxypeptidase
MTFPPVALGVAPVKKENLEIIKDGMKGVVEEPGGTAHAAKSSEVTIGGKTGTAQVVGLGKGGGKDYKDHAWFVAVAPLDNPKIAVCVLVEHGGHGGSAAAPLAKKVIEAYLRVDEESKKRALGNMTGVNARKMANTTGAGKKTAKAAKDVIPFKNASGTAKKMKNTTGVATRALRN